MRTTRIAIGSVGVVGLALAGFYSWPPGTDKEAPTTEVISGRQVPGRTGGTQPESARAMIPRPLAVASSAHLGPSPAERHKAAEAHQSQAASGVVDALVKARHETQVQRRIEALQFLGEHAPQEHLEALQQIQIQDPAPEVRRAAEAAIHSLMIRFSGQPWPGIPSGEEPFGYMREIAAPGEVP